MRSRNLESLRGSVQRCIDELGAFLEQLDGCYEIATNQQRASYERIVDQLRARQMELVSHGDRMLCRCPLEREAREDEIEAVWAQLEKSAQSISRELMKCIGDAHDELQCEGYPQAARSPRDRADDSDE